jgi:hypothetical protein
MVPMLPTLWSDSADSCEHFPLLHKLLEDKFMATVHRFFQPVASMPDYFFYSPEAQQRTSRVCKLLFFFSFVFTFHWFLCLFVFES